jgi:hypothetical protein
MPLFPRKNVHKAHADPDDAHHQKYAGPNMLSHDNASSIVAVRAELDAGNLGFSRQNVVRLYQIRDIETVG